MFGHGVYLWSAHMESTNEVKTLMRRITALGSKTAKWREEVQTCLVGCIHTAIVLDSNIDPCIKIVSVLKGADVRAIIHYLEQYAPVIWSKSEETFKFNKSFKGEFDALFLAGHPWFDQAVTPKQVSSSIDCLEAVRDLVKRLEREVKSGKKIVTHVDAIDELKAVAGRMAMRDMKAKAKLPEGQIVQ